MDRDETMGQPRSAVLSCLQVGVHFPRVEGMSDLRRIRTSPRRKKNGEPADGEFRLSNLPLAFPFPLLVPSPRKSKSNRVSGGSKPS